MFSQYTVFTTVGTYTWVQLELVISQEWNNLGVRAMVTESSNKCYFYNGFGVIAQHKLLFSVIPVKSFYIRNQHLVMTDIRLLQGTLN